MTVADSPHTLYRLFDDTGVLLYVGVAVNLANRLRGHCCDKSWWVTVHGVATERLPDRKSALAAERRAIQRDHPKYNHLMNHHRDTANAVTVVPNQLTAIAAMSSYGSQLKTNKAEYEAIMASMKRAVIIADRAGITGNEIIKNSGFCPAGPCI